ncbi:uncharacterized protein K452DRAFT_245127 [Aplosporella prunicola CBS 121167]|uniref:Uncharacterized protein n=1 Tax=Aplosporella prunicola CBS 121167 TaxID=1176127 RepID=A0A6A6BJN2_9PEZI|nr:uncharacterized protein K452DRAFT_245127 [Aplosporella prunicola CBS 121167]KAF2144359.1 hypothetical protein K452DRAFT_245127 [Aplosporella prunicola CBS 121167]
MYLTVFATVSALAAVVTGQCTTMDSVTHTFFGFPDNDPAGPATAYDCGRNYVAGGSGTYDDPLTFASAPGEFEICEIIYDPYLKKYLRLEDYCEQCTQDWSNRNNRHIDVWTGSSTVNGEGAQIQCENDLTPASNSQTIIRQPGANLPVDNTVLFADGQCYTSNVYANYNIGDYC